MRDTPDVGIPKDVLHKVLAHEDIDTPEGNDVAQDGDDADRSRRARANAPGNVREERS